MRFKPPGAHLADHAEPITFEEGAEYEKAIRRWEKSSTDMSTYRAPGKADWTSAIFFLSQRATRTFRWRRGCRSIRPSSTRRASRRTTRWPSRRRRRWKTSSRSSSICWRKRNTNSRSKQASRTSSKLSLMENRATFCVNKSCTGLKIILTSKVQCVLFWKIAPQREEGEKREGVQNLKQSTQNLWHQD